MTPLPPERSICEALAAGDPGPFAALYDRMGGPLLRVAVTMLGARHEAEDALQDLFVNLARGRRRFLDVNDLDAYVFASLRYLLRSRLAARRREHQQLQKFAMTREVRQCLASPEGEAFAGAIAGLPVEQREVISLKLDGGLTFAQIATALAISPNTAASRYRYALLKLRDRLENER